MSQKCSKDMDELAYLYLHEELSADEREKFETHLSDCEHCQQIIKVMTDIMLDNEAKSIISDALASPDEIYQFESNDAEEVSRKKTPLKFIDSVKSWLINLIPPIQRTAPTGISRSVKVEQSKSDLHSDGMPDSEILKHKNAIKRISASLANYSVLCILFCWRLCKFAVKNFSSFFMACLAKLSSTIKRNSNTR